MKTTKNEEENLNYKNETKVWISNDEPELCDELLR